MSHPGTRITVDAAMRARDVSRPQAEAPPPVPADTPPPSRAKPRKGERRRLGKRAAARRTLGQEGSGGS
jgi:hypothetical protein